MRQVVVPWARSRPVWSVRRPSAVPTRRPAVEHDPLCPDLAGVGQDRPHEGDLEFQRRRAEALFDRRPDRETHAAIEQRRREATMHRAGRVEVLAVGRGGDDDPTWGYLDDVVAQRPRHAVQRQRPAHQPLHEFQPAQGGLDVGAHDAVALCACVLIHDLHLAHLLPYPLAESGLDIDVERRQLATALPARAGPVRCSMLGQDPEKRR